MEPSSAGGDALFPSGESPLVLPHQEEETLGRMVNPTRDLKEFAFMYACCFIIIMLIPAFLLILFYQGPDSVCNSPQCLDFSRLLSSSVNPALNPCINFYTFVCDGWEKKYDHSVKDNHLGAYIKALSEKLTDIRIPAGNQTAVEKAAIFYQSCLDIVLRRRNENEDFKRLLKEGNVTWPYVIPDVDFLKVMTYALVHWNAYPFLAFSKSVASDGSTVVEIRASTLLSIWYHERQKLITRKRYYTYHTNAYKLVTDSEPDMKEFHNYKTVEDKILNKFMPTFKSSESAMLTEDEFKNHSTAFEYARWRTVFSEILRITQGENVTIAVQNVPYFDALNEVTLQVHEPQMVLTLGWCILFTLGHVMLGGLTSALYYSPREAEEAAISRCLLHVEEYMGLALSARYVMEAIPPEVYAGADNLTQNLIARMAKVLRRDHNLDFNYTNYRRDRTELFLNFDRLKDTAELERIFSYFPNMGVHFLKNHIRAVAAWRKRTDDQKFYDGRYLQVRDYYHMYREEDKDIAIWPPALTAPLYAPDTTFALQYGALGPLVAGAIAEDIFANVPQPRNSNWTEAVVTFTSCFNGTSKALRKSVFYRMVSGSVLWETFNRAAGVDVHRGTVDIESKVTPILKTQTKEPRIQGFSRYNPDQLFFMVMCYIHCGGHEDDCNAVVRNLDEFSDAFNCSKGTPMNPYHKCSVF